MVIAGIPPTDLTVAMYKMKIQLRIEHDRSKLNDKWKWEISNKDRCTKIPNIKFWASKRHMLITTISLEHL